MISGNRIYPVEILLPPKPIQDHFDKMKAEFLAALDRQKLSKAKIDLLFETILYKAFSGELTAQWREAHMKELLAEMEQQSKALEIAVKSKIKTNK